MNHIDKYINLIRRYVEGEISVAIFEESYLQMFKNEVYTFPENTYQTLNSLFVDVDAYCDDPTLRDADDLNADQLLESAINALDSLNKQC